MISFGVDHFDESLSGIDQFRGVDFNVHAFMDHGRTCGGKFSVYVYRANSAGSQRMILVVKMA